MEHFREYTMTRSCTEIYFMGIEWMLILAGLNVIAVMANWVQSQRLSRIRLKTGTVEVGPK